MKRRDFLGAATAATLLPAAAARAGTGVSYSVGMVDEAQAAGKTMMLDFYTDWCSTCARQERIIKEFQAANPAYQENIVFIDIDWDIHSRSDLAKRLRIPRRSTLVVLKSRFELGRLVADTRPDRIRRLMDTALSAAT